MASSRLERIGTIFTRKQLLNELHKNVNQLAADLEDDYKAAKENLQKVQHITDAVIKNMQQVTEGVLKNMQQVTDVVVKNMQQVTAAFKQKLEPLEEMQALCQDRVEGLLARGGMKPDDRPIWYDVYKSFPPLVEPKFARPKPDLTPVRQIFYKEDVIRAEFHSKGHGLAAINILAQSNDTQIKRLVQEYEKLKAEGVAEEELIEKSATAVGIERKEQYEATVAAKSAKITPENPSVTAQVLAEADLKNIFKE